MGFVPTQGELHPLICPGCSGARPSLVAHPTPATPSQGAARRRPAGGPCAGGGTLGCPSAFSPRFCSRSAAARPHGACSFRQWLSLPAAACDAHAQTDPAASFVGAPQRCQQRPATVTSLEARDPVPQSPLSEFRDASISSAPSGTPRVSAPGSPPPSLKMD